MERQRGEHRLSPTDWQALAVRATAAGAIVGEDVTPLLRRFGDTPAERHTALLQALTDRELAVMALVMWAWPIEDGEGGDIDDKTRARLNARLAIPGADAELRALGDADLERLAVGGVDDGRAR